MPWPLCFANGFTLGAVSPAVVVPSLMILYKKGFGVKKGIPTTLIAAASFDDIIAITVFGVFLTIAFNEAPGGAAEEEDSIAYEVGMNLLQLFVGLVIGLTLGYCMRVFNFCNPRKTMIPKFIVTLIVAFLIPILSEVSGFHESKFVGIIFYGYMCFRVWGDEKPEHHLGIFWMFC